MSDDPDSHLYNPDHLPKDFLSSIPQQFPSNSPAIPRSPTLNPNPILRPCSSGLKSPAAAAAAAAAGGGGGSAAADGGAAAAGGCGGTAAADGGAAAAAAAGGAAAADGSGADGGGGAAVATSLNLKWQYSK
ncbi:hypothetical protein FHG87_021074 [Trinorchestia longiramus]|nr:hypothetical protein FHG87_021074 [Trinorchestia longiramus]